MATDKKLSYEAAREELALICQEWLDGARKKLSAAKPKAE